MKWFGHREGRLEVDPSATLFKTDQKLPISRPAEKDQSPKVQTDTRRTRLRTCSLELLIR